MGVLAGIPHHSKGAEGRELARADLVEAEVDDGLACAAVEARLCVGKIRTLHHRLLTQQILGLTLALVALINFVSARYRRHLGIFCLDRRMHLMERQLRRLTDELLQFLGIFEAGELNENAVGALSDDGRF